MSYNVAVALKPIPSNEQDAWEWVNRMAELDNDSPPQVFHDLIDVLTSRYPCICNLDDELVDVQGVWSDGPLRDNITLVAPVLGIVYSKVDEVLPFLIETANSLELTVFDWNTEKIYRPLSSTST
ncbi:hypothetical protein [Acaryochloris sp. CCMEE 5410]|uniref:hypothetical protein n=1 Tax=Acaryochloris sp. CCMEE 5410 TaxID=310037 RepID=UPI0002484A8A|nr:hypothetical protein [Acaryochloris sp. CCMEE 5410]KAI9133165.1 hypothetical protein ON05_007465 [Acaryochloris sp. CCMEE 5410]